MFDVHKSTYFMQRQAHKRPNSRTPIFHKRRRRNAVSPIILWSSLSTPLPGEESLRLQFALFFDVMGELPVFTFNYGRLKSNVAKQNNRG